MMMSQQECQKSQLGSPQHKVDSDVRIALCELQFFSRVQLAIPCNCWIARNHAASFCPSLALGEIWIIWPKPGMFSKI